MIAGRRGGYCFEQNMLFRGALRALGFKVTSLQARVVRGLAVDAPRAALASALFCLMTIWRGRWTRSRRRGVRARRTRSSPEPSARRDDRLAFGSGLRHRLIR
jgi:arylamine N-acetyltransferase